MKKSKIRTLQVALIGATLLNVSLASFGWCSPPTAADFPDEVTFHFNAFPDYKNNEAGLWFLDVPQKEKNGKGITTIGNVNKYMKGYNPEKPHLNPFAPSGASFPAEKVRGKSPTPAKGWTDVWELPYTAGEFEKPIMIHMDWREK